MEDFELEVIFKNHCGSCVETGLWRPEDKGRAVQMCDDGGQDWSACWKVMGSWCRDGVWKQHHQDS